MLRYYQSIGLGRKEARKYIKDIAMQARKEKQAWRNGTRVSPFYAPNQEEEPRR